MRHISDADLLRLIDSELSSRRVATVRAHLEACSGCREREAGMRRTLGAVAEWDRLREPLPSIDGPAAGLQARLAQLAAADAGARSMGVAGAVQAHLHLALIAAVVVLGIATILVVRTPARSGWLPDKHLTPGAGSSAAKAAICAADVMSDPAPVADGLALRVFEQYGIRNPQPRAFEVDYLIPPALGGSDDIRNLWPQPYGDGTWNAHVKDALEDRLHGLVCSGELDLSTAQRDIASDWVQAYRKYFRVNEPLELHAQFSKDPPWE